MMNVFFTFLELSTILFIGVQLLRKGALSVVYLPLFLFVNMVVESSIPTSVNQLILMGLMAYYFVYHIPFITKNIFTILISFYFLLLYTLEPGNQHRTVIIQVISLFLLIGIIPEIYKKYSRSEIFDELSLSGFLILLAFILNTVFSSLFKYNPEMMYGISGGVLFGKISQARFNIIPLACFIVFKRAIENRNILYFAAFIIAVFLILLSMRRTVMLLSVLGSLILVFSLVDFKNLKKLILISFLLGSVSLIVAFNTGFLDTFKERYELRKLDDRDLKEEGRFAEIFLVYKDLFVYYDYDPWFGYGLFDSSSNYGKGEFGSRPLHTDLTVIIHSAGFFGLFLYLAMISIAFYIAWQKTSSKLDKLQYLFILVSFIVYFITGRFTMVNGPILLFLILFLPLGRNFNQKAPAQNLESYLKGAKTVV
jgi:O-antigen ligase